MKKYDYSIFLETETEKYDFLAAVRGSGATLTAVSGCGTGYVINVDATPEEAAWIERTWYAPEIHALRPRQAWAEWKSGRLTVGQLATYQARHGLYFRPDGSHGRLPA